MGGASTPSAELTVYLQQDSAANNKGRPVRKADPYSIIPGAILFRPKGFYAALLRIFAPEISAAPIALWHRIIEW